MVVIYAFIVLCKTQVHAVKPSHKLIQGIIKAT